MSRKVLVITMKKLIQLSMITSLLFTNPHNIINNIERRAFVAEVTVKEYWENEVLINEIRELISSSKKGELALSITYDRRDENKTGFVYYCYGGKFGYCNIE